MANQKRKIKVGFKYASRFIIWAWIMLVLTIIVFGIGMGTDYWVRTYDGDVETSRGIWNFCRHENIAVFPYRYERRCYSLDLLDPTGKKPWFESIEVVRGMEATALFFICFMVAIMIPLYILLVRLKGKAMVGILMALCVISIIMIVIGVVLFWLDFVDVGIGSMGWSIPMTLVGAGVSLIALLLLIAEFVQFDKVNYPK